MTPGPSVEPLTSNVKTTQFPPASLHFAMKGIQMTQTYTAVVKQDADWWIGWIEEVPGVNCQESTRERLLDSLRKTLSEAIELNRVEARIAAGNTYEELLIAV